MKKSPWIAALVLTLFVLIALLLLVFLPEVFSGEREPNPIAITVGALQVRWYGILIASGAFIAYLLVDAESRRLRIANGSIELVVFLVLVLGLLGARMGFVIQNVHYFFREVPSEFFKIYHGGLSIHGALVGGILALLIAQRYSRTSFYRLANIIAPPVLLAIAIGRWGNFFNQEIIGRPAQIPWKMFVGALSRPNGMEGVAYFHPVFIYESIALLIVFGIYWFFLRNREIGLIYTLCGYCVVRIIVEFWRIDYKPIILRLDLAQIVSFGIIALTLLIYFVAKRSSGGRLTKRGK